MRGISEERLNELKDNDCYSGIEQSVIYELLSDECKEINPWLPIASAPLNKNIRLFQNYMGNGQIDALLRSDDDRKYFSHWMELPGDPKE